MPRREIFLLTVKGERARPGLTAALTVTFPTALPLARTLCLDSTVARRGPRAVSGHRVCTTQTWRGGCLGALLCSARALARCFASLSQAEIPFSVLLVLTVGSFRKRWESTT